MSSSLNLYKLLSSEDLTELVDKLNRNFDIISANGGGPQGNDGNIGNTGLVGPPGGLGPVGGTGIQGSIWMYATEVPSAVTENVTPDVFSSITPSNPRRGDMLVLTKRDGTYSKAYRYETTITSPVVPVWNEIVELNTQNALYLKLDIFRFNDFTRNFPTSASYKSICYEDNTTAKNFQNRIYFQNRKDYLIFTGNNLQSAQNLTNFQIDTIDKLLAKDEYTDAILPKGKVNILSGSNPHMTFLYFKDQDDTEIVTYPSSGDTIVSNTFQTSDPLNKVAYNGQWANLKMTEQGTLILESTGDIQVNPKTNNQPSGKFSIFGKTLVLQGSTIHDQTLGYVPTAYFNSTTGNTLLLPKNLYDGTANPNGQMELAIYPKTVDPNTAGKPLIMAFNNIGGFDATSKFFNLNTAQEGKETLGWLDMNLDKLGAPYILSATNRRILTAGGNDANPFGYDYEKLEDLSIPEKDRPNVFQKRNKFETFNTISTTQAVASVSTEASLPGIGSGAYIAVEAALDIYGRQPAAITTTNIGNCWEITAPLVNDIIVKRLYIATTQTDDPVLPIASMKGLKMTFVNNTTKNIIFKRWISTTDGIIYFGKWSNAISQNPNLTSEILPGYDVITIKPNAKITLTVTSVVAGATQWSACQCQLDSVSDTITSLDSNQQKGLIFKDAKKYIISGGPTSFTTPAQKETMYSTQNQTVSGGTYGSNPNYAANGSGVLFIDATTDTHVLLKNSSPEAAALINRIDLNRLGPNIKYGTTLKIKLDSRYATAPGFGTIISFQFVKESTYTSSPVNLTEQGIIMLPDYEWNLISAYLGSYSNANWIFNVSVSGRMVVNYIGYGQSTELQLMYRDGFYNGAGTFVNFGHFVVSNSSLAVAGLIGRTNDLQTQVTNNLNSLTNRLDSIRTKTRAYIFNSGTVNGGTAGAGNVIIWNYPDAITRSCRITVTVTADANKVSPGYGGYWSTTLALKQNGGNVAVDVQASNVYDVSHKHGLVWCGNFSPGHTISLGAAEFGWALQMARVQVVVHEDYEWI